MNRLGKEVLKGRRGLVGQQSPLMMTRYSRWATKQQHLWEESAAVGMQNRGNRKRPFKLYCLVWVAAVSTVAVRPRSFDTWCKFPRCVSLHFSSHKEFGNTKGKFNKSFGSSQWIKVTEREANRAALEAILHWMVIGAKRLMWGWHLPSEGVCH